MTLERLAAVLEQIGADPRLPALQSASALPPKRARIRSEVHHGYRYWRVDFYDGNGLRIDSSPLLRTWRAALSAAKDWTR